MPLNVYKDMSAVFFALFTFLSDRRDRGRTLPL